VTILRAAALAAAVCLFGRSAAADPDAPVDRAPYLRLSLGPAFAYESWSPTGGAAGASYTGWGPALDVAIGRAVAPGLVVAGDLQVTGIVNRTESYLGTSYDLSETLHLLSTLGGLVVFTPRRRPLLRFGAGLGLLLATDVDTHMGGDQTSLGLAAFVEGGVERPLSGRWARWRIGGLARLTLYHFWTDAPPPDSTSTGLAPMLLVSFVRR
jgi:hypothetical protein